MVLIALQFSAGDHNDRPPLFRGGARRGGMSSRHVIGKIINGASYLTFGSIREEKNEQEAVGGQGAHGLFLSKIFLDVLRSSLHPLLGSSLCSSCQWRARGSEEDRIGGGVRK